MRRSKTATDAPAAITLATDAVRTFERAYELESWDFARHALQIDIARAAVDAGLSDVARRAAEAVLRDAPQFERTWQYGNAIHWAHIVLGHVALRNDLDTACAELSLAGRTPGSPQLNSFGPDLTLAQRILDCGRIGAVLDYLTECKRFWEMDRGDLDLWIGQIASGGRPRLNLA